MMQQLIDMGARVLSFGYTKDDVLWKIILFCIHYNGQKKGYIVVIKLKSMVLIRFNS